MNLVIVLSVLLGIASSNAQPRPLLLQANQGEQRARVPLAGIKRLKMFTIKVDASNGGARNFVMIREDFPPGATIRSHRHLHEDEILLTENGKIRVRVGDDEAVLGPHATVFIPQNTWVTLTNVGSETIRLVAIFDRPGYDAYLRCSSVPAGQPARTLTRRQDEACAKAGDVEYR
jgi:quercetin dioxygenase-like cupin family protein